MTPVLLLLVMKQTVNIRNKVLWCMSSVLESWRAEFSPRNRCFVIFLIKLPARVCQSFPCSILGELGAGGGTRSGWGRSSHEYKAFLLLSLEV